MKVKLTDRSGRLQTTGRYDTRKELEYWVWRMYLSSDMNMAQIARACKISGPTVRSILDGPSPKEADEWRQERVQRNSLTARNVGSRHD